MQLQTGVDGWIINTMVFICLIKIVSALVLASSSYQKGYGNALASCNAMNIKDISIADDAQSRNVPEKSAADSATTATRVTTEKNGNASIITEVVLRSKCDEEPLDVDGCTSYIRGLDPRSAQHETLFKQIKDILQVMGTPICLHSNGSVLYYDPIRQLCCDGVVNRITHHEECCEGTVIDNRTHVCCNSKVYAQNETTDCCGETVYDTRQKLCCNGQLNPLVKDLECCGNVTFNTEIQMCCNGNVQKIHGLLNSRGTCCGDISYQMGCHDCKGGQKLTALFDPSTEICCDGEIYSRLYGQRSECCRRSQINGDVHACLGNKIVSKSTQVLAPGTSTSTGSLGVSLNVDGQSTTTVAFNQGDQSGQIKPVSVLIYSLIIGCPFLLVVALLLIKHQNCWRLLLREEKTLASDTASTQRLVRKRTDTHVGRNNAEHTNFKDSNCVSLIKDTNIPQNKSTETTTNAEQTANAEQEGDSFEALIAKSSNDRFPIETSFVKKQNVANDTNLFSTYSKDNDTQTSLENVSLRRTIFGQHFDHAFMLDEDKQSFKIPNSEVSFTLPTSITKQEKVKVVCSSFRSLPALRKKLGVSDDEMIASPVAEFAVTGHGTLPEHAIVVVPFVGKASDLRVRKFESDEGLNTVATSSEIQERTKENMDLDICYSIEGSYLIIYAKTFSGFYCTRNKHKRDRDLGLRAFIFGSYKRINREYKVSIAAYIADEIFKFEDYKERMRGNEFREHREQLKDHPLLMPSFDLNDQDHIEAFLFLENGWIHKRHPRWNRPIQEERKELPLSRIAKECSQCAYVHPSEPEMPFSTEWSITSAEDTPPSDTFSCTIDLNICKCDPGLRQENSIEISELRLNSSDRLPIKEDFTKEMVPSRSVQESCRSSPPFQGASRTAPLAATTEQLHLITLESGQPNQGNVRGEGCQLPVYSHIEPDSTNNPYRRTRHHTNPIPEISNQFQTDQYQALLLHSNEENQ